MTLIFRRLFLPALVLLSACSDAPTAVVRTDRQPILFVHGIGGSADDWSPILARFRSDGWTDRELIAKTYGTSGNASTAATIRDDVAAALGATGWDRVTIISFSMGSLSSRHYVRNLGGTDVVEAWVSISGPNHGTTTAEQCLPLKACQEMLPGSAFLEALAVRPAGEPAGEHDSRGGDQHANCLPASHRDVHGGDLSAGEGVHHELACHELLVYKSVTWPHDRLRFTAPGPPRCWHPHDPTRERWNADSSEGILSRRKR